MNGNTQVTVCGAALLIVFLTPVLTPPVARSQSSPAPIASRPPQSAASIASLEFPVQMRQKVIAGETPVGSKIQATLSVATLFNGLVVPQGAIFSGELTESTARSAAQPSRLAIRVDSLEWKDKAQSNQPTVIAFSPNIYLTIWYYPLASPVTKESMASESDARGHRNSASPFPSSDPDKPHPPSSEISSRRIRMKDVESTHNAEGAIVLSSEHASIRLDKTTTYVFAPGGLH